MIVAGTEVIGSGAPFQAEAAATGTVLSPAFRTAGEAQVQAALAAAHAAAPGFAQSPPGDRAALLEAIAGAILGCGPALIQRAELETGLPTARLEAERMRTINQLRLFAQVLREGDFARVRIDHARPDRTPAPKPDLRLFFEALGPVAVFGASNFPLAFSVAGGDTASALAAGCPVIVKGHPAHPGTSEIAARAVDRAVRDSGFDPGVFSMLHDAGIEVGRTLVADPRVKAVGFTGSRRAGEALLRIAADRPEPIPVFAEMSAINPVILLPGRLEEAAEAIGAAFAGSMTMGSGQFCTSPGLILAIAGPALDRFTSAASDALRAWAPGTMLTAGIRDAFVRATQAVAEHATVEQLAEGASADARATAALFATSASDFLAHPQLHHEMFGPAALVLRCTDAAEMVRVLDAIDGQLTVALHFNEADHDAVRALLPVAQRKTGRVIANGFGTGVEVSPAMVHGGPYPATSDARTTSVGTLAIERFLRPVCLQDFPETVLPPAVAEANPWGLPRREW